MSAVMQEAGVMIDPELRSHLVPLKTEERDQLEAALLEDGIRTPLVLWGDVLVDGHNRYEIAQAHGLSFEVERREFADRDAVLDWMDREQIGRRNVTPDQLRMLIGRLYNRRKQQGVRNDLTSRQDDGKLHAAEEVARESGVSPRTVERAGADAAAIDAAEPVVGAAVMRGDLPVRDATALAALPREEQAEIVAKGETEILEAAKAIRAKKSEARREQNAQVAAVKMSPPKGRYSTIVIDPPWQMQKVDRDCRPNQTSELDYPTMSPNELVEFGEIVDAMANEDAHLFMWTTQKWLPFAIELLGTWDWKYVLTLVWHKPGSLAASYGRCTGTCLFRL